MWLSLHFVVLDSSTEPYPGLVGVIPWGHCMGVKKYMIVNVVHDKGLLELIWRPSWAGPF